MLRNHLQVVFVMLMILFWVSRGF